MWPDSCRSVGGLRAEMLRTRRRSACNMYQDVIKAISAFAPVCRSKSVRYSTSGRGEKYSGAQACCLFPGGVVSLRYRSIRHVRMHRTPYCLHTRSLVCHQDEEMVPTGDPSYDAVECIPKVIPLVGRSAFCRGMADNKTIHHFIYPRNRCEPSSVSH